MILLWWVDKVISQDDYIGWNRNSIRNSQLRWANNHKKWTDLRRSWRRKKPRPKKKLRSAVLLGSSTSVDWLAPAYLARLKGYESGTVLDAHINGCHQGCTYASVRRLLLRRRRFNTAFFGTNLFQICEHAHSKRVFQHSVLLPTRDIPRMLGLYLSAEQPMKYMGRFIGDRLSSAYGETSFLQSTWAKALFGSRKRRDSQRWYTHTQPPGKPFEFCDYEADHIRYKLAVTEALLDDMKKLAGRVYLMLLPDVSLSSPDPETRAIWEKHRAVHQAMADERKDVHLVDLTQEGGAREAVDFRDGFHVSAQGKRLQRALFVKLMGKNGFLPKDKKTAAKDRTRKQAKDQKGE